jgi:hypothetical protein
LEKSVSPPTGDNRRALSMDARIGISDIVPSMCQ